MFKKSFILLKSNPLLIILFILAVAAYAIPMLLLLPETQKIMELSRGIADNPIGAASVDFQQMTEMMLSTLKMYLVLLVLGILGLVYMTGYGNMFAAAVNGGRASFQIFLYGIRKLFGKVFLSALLLIAIVIGGSLVISVCTMPFTFAALATNRLNVDNMMNLQKGIQIVTLVLSAFLYPLVELWLPAVFLEREDGVMACFRKGFRAGLKNYLPLVAVTAVMILPLLLFYIVSGDIYSLVDSPLYLLSFAYQAVVAPVVLAFLFLLYKDAREKRASVEATIH